jgi:hypothetical protein
VAKHEDNGKWYCKHHHPPSAAQKMAEKHARYDQEREATKLARDKEISERNEMKRRSGLYPELLETLKLAKWMLERDYVDPQKMAVIEKCDDAIAKAEGRS